MKNKRSLLFRFVAVSGFFLSFNAFGEDITIFTEDFPAETEKVKENEIGGIGGEIITKALKAKHITYTVKWTPWARAQQEIKKNEDHKSFIAPLTRNKEREADYHWTVKIYDSETAFMTPKGAKKINSFADAKGKKIGVLLGSSYEQTLKDKKTGLDPSDLDIVPKDETNPSKMAADTPRINGWYTSVIGGFAIVREVNKTNKSVHAEKFEVGAPVDVEENYLATVASTPEPLRQKVAQAIEDFKKTAEYKSILKQYTGK